MGHGSQIVKRKIEVHLDSFASEASHVYKKVSTFPASEASHRERSEPLRAKRASRRQASQVGPAPQGAETGLRVHYKMADDDNGKHVE